MKTFLAMVRAAISRNIFQYSYDELEEGAAQLRAIADYLEAISIKKVELRTRRPTNELS